MRTTAARRAVAGLVLAVGLPLAASGVALAQSGPSGPSGGATTTSSTTSTTINITTTTRPGTGTLSRTGGEWALPLAASGGAIAVVLGGRRLAARSIRS